MRRRASLLAVMLCALQGSAHAICTAPQSVREEAASSDAIVLARVKAERRIVAPDDPEGFEATVYTLDILQRYKGRTPGRIGIESPNTSSRFPMERGKQYVLFLRKNPSSWDLNPCGNSTGPLHGKRTRVLAELRRAGYVRATP